MKATEKQRIYFKQYFQKNKGAIRERKRRHYREHIQDRLAKHNYYLCNRERILKQRRGAETRLYELAHKAERLKRSKDYNARVRLEAISFYSNGANKCVRCNLDDIRLLTIDHIDGGGTQHRKRIKSPIANWLKREGFPKGYQILCWNCQMLKRIERRETR